MTRRFVSVTAQVLDLMFSILLLLVTASNAEFVIVMGVGVGGGKRENL